MLDVQVCQKARLSRDPRFDGKFFTAVKTTRIFCRTICPVYPPKEENVVYYSSAIECANAGFRPCLRCRPDSAPNSPAWKGVNTTLDRAIRLIDEGDLQTGSLVQLSARLGISDRYLRQLFTKYLGMSPKAYALYQQCLFAKQLLHQTKLPITQVALASGFESVRRFNDCFKAQLKLTPSQMRKSDDKQSNILSLKISYRPPFDWPYMQNIFATRAINSLEWCDDKSYGRTFNWHGCIGSFTAKNCADKNLFEVKITLDNVKNLKAIVNNIRRVLDVDVDMQAVEHDLQHCLTTDFPLKSGIRIPGIWTLFEAGIRAILGQQISVVAARNLVSTLVENLGEKYGDHYLFPTPEAIATSDFSFIKMPGSRKQTLRNLAQHYIDHQTPNEPEQWLSLKGIGPWTVDYAKMRGLSAPDIFLGGDLGVKKVLATALVEAPINELEHELANKVSEFDPESAAPWRSYLTFQLWSQL
jgi:AraC family transcriptional regulator of adaptative response / DNA-3-methyladenine glycosylase II